MAWGSWPERLAGGDPPKARARHTAQHDYLDGKIYCGLGEITMVLNQIKSFRLTPLRSQAPWIPILSLGVLPKTTYSSLGWRCCFRYLSRYLRLAKLVLTACSTLGQVQFSRKQHIQLHLKLCKPKIPGYTLPCSETATPCQSVFATPSKCAR